MSPDAILRRVVDLNRRVNGGWVVLKVHPIFGSGRWVVQVDPIARHPVELTIATGPNAREQLRRAERWLKARSDDDGLFQVDEYLGSDEYAKWCAHILRGPVSPPRERAALSSEIRGL